MIKVCLYCGEKFETNRERQIYCQGYCAHYDKMKKNRERSLTRWKEKLDKKLGRKLNT